MAFSLSDADLAAIGGASTFVLAAVAVAQMRHSGRQIEALRGQVEASTAQSQAVREAARAQLQPIVFSRHVQPGTLHEPHPSLRDGQVGFCYRLINEGTGLALNVEHGIEIDGKSFAFRPYLCIRPGESIPRPPDPEEIAELESMEDYLESSWPSRIEGFVLAVPKDELPPKWGMMERTNWVRFENVFGERFETSSTFPRRSPAQSDVFKRIETVRDA